MSWWIVSLNAQFASQFSQATQSGFLVSMCFARIVCAPRWWGKRLQIKMRNALSAKQNSATETCERPRNLTGCETCGEPCETKLIWTLRCLQVFSCSIHRLLLNSIETNRKTKPFRRNHHRNPICKKRLNSKLLQHVFGKKNPKQSRLLNEKRLNHFSENRKKSLML